MARLFPKRLVFRFGWTVAVLLFFFLASSSQAQTRSAAPKARSLDDIQFDSRPEEMEIRINTNGRIPDYRVMQMLNPYLTTATTSFTQKTVTTSFTRSFETV